MVRDEIQEVEAQLLNPTVRASPDALDRMVVLAIYRTAGSLRSSLWRREAGDWRIVFHQGTPVVSRSEGSSS